MKLIKIDDDLIINEDKISHIFITNEKAIVNFNHSITLSDGRRVSNYIYAKHDNNWVNELDRSVFSLFETNNRKVYINKEHISSIKLDRANHRIIFNMSSDIDSQNITKFKTITDFIFVDVDNNIDLEDQLNALQ